MSTTPRMCFDKILPGQLYSAPEVPPQRRPDGVIQLRAIMPRGKKWPVASKLHVKFMGGTAEQRKLVQDFAPIWCESANLEFVFDNSPRAEIRITFDANDGAWSYVGTDCQGIPLHAATMNLGWQDEAVILHEFGHAIGLAHEHQNPEGGIQWQDEVVIRALGGAPNYWDPDTVRHNVLSKYSADQINGTRFDPESIMLYAFPANWTKNGIGTKENTKLSDLDRQFIASPPAYPGRATGDTKAIVELKATEIVAVAAAISKPGEEDLFSFKVEKAGVYVIETEGGTDVAAKLFGPNSRTKLVAEDDDSGVDTNAKIATQLLPGTYYLQVRHYSPSATGQYRVKVYF